VEVRCRRADVEVWSSEALETRCRRADGIQIRSSGGALQVVVLVVVDEVAHFVIIRGPKARRVNRTINSSLPNFLL